VFPYHRLAPRRSKRKAVVAVAYSILVIAYQALKNQLPSKKDLGPEYFDRLKVTRLQRLHVKRLESLGFKITLEPLPKAAQRHFLKNISAAPNFLWQESRRS